MHQPTHAFSKSLDEAATIPPTANPEDRKTMFQTWLKFRDVMDAEFAPEYRQPADPAQTNLPI